MQTPAATDYRVYVLDQSGHFIGAHVIHARDDAGAVALAGDLENSHGVEVWQRGRRVALLGPDRAAA
jgi:hypothetical protein